MAAEELAPGEEEQGQEGQEQQGNKEDPIKNLKSEFARKMDNFQEQFQSQNQQIEALLQTLQQSKNPPSQADQVKLSELIYDDPDKAVEEMERRITEKVDQRTQNIQEQQTKIAQVTNHYQSQYPEFQDPNSAAYKKAIAVYSALPAAQQNAQAAKTAFLEAIAEEGLVPLSKRKKGEEMEDFSLSGKGGSSNRGKGKGNKEPEISEGTIAFAKAMNPNRSEKEIIEGLKKTVKRDEWNKWR